MARLPLTLGTQFQSDTLAWVREMVDGGEALLRSEPSYAEIPASIGYVMGDQIGKRPAALSSVRDNRLKKITLETVSALTDIHPLFGFQSFNPNFQPQVVILDKLTRAWWVNTYADLRLADMVRYACATGTGYLEVTWDQSLAGGLGDIVLAPTDPRDVLPIAPKFDFSVQSWQGVILRSMETCENLEARYGLAAAGLKPDRGPQTWTNRLWTATKTLISTPVATPPRPNDHGHNMPQGVSAKEVYKTYYRDLRLWAGDAPITMGEPGTTWCYTVYPVGWTKEDGSIATSDDARLYPRGRLIVSTRDRVLFDGPNPYWHGMFPVVKLSLDPWPWSLLGGSLVGDLRPLQDSLNATVNGFLDHVNVCLRPMVIGDSNIPDREWKKLDPRLPGQKIKEKANAPGKGLRIEMPPPLPADVEFFMNWAKDEMDYLSGVANMQALMQLAQAPGADSVEKLQEALTPLLRLKGRLLEVTLRELGEMVKTNFFQFYTAARRCSVLGEGGLDMQDFDFDPGTLVPSMHPNDAGYDAKLDFRLPAFQRARQHHNNFTFQLTPNSLLAQSQLKRQLTFLRLRQMELMDMWSLFEALEIPNGGTPPEGVTTIPERIAAEGMLRAQAQIAIQMATMPQMPGAPGAGGPDGNPVGGGNPPGRPPSFEAPEAITQKNDENGIPRVTQTTS